MVHQRKDKKTAEELQRRNKELAATETAAALIVKQKEYENIKAYNLLKQEQGCLQWLHASMDERIKALGSKPSICSVCLAAPDRWNDAKTMCKKTQYQTEKR